MRLDSAAAANDARATLYGTCPWCVGAISDDEPARAIGDRVLHERCFAEFDADVYGAPADELVEAGHFAGEAV